MLMYKIDIQDVRGSDNIIKIRILFFFFLDFGFLFFLLFVVFEYFLILIELQMYTLLAMLMLKAELVA